MEFYGIHSKFAKAIQDKIITDFESFIINFLNIEKVPIPHDYQFVKKKINKGDLVYKLNGSGDLAISTTEEFIKTIEYLDNRFISVTSKTLKYTDDDEIDIFIFFQTPENPNKFEWYPPITNIFRMSSWGTNYFIKEIRPLKKELKNFIKRDFTSKKEYYNEIRAKWSFRLAWIAIAMSIASIIISTYFNYISLKSINSVKIIDDIKLKNDSINVLSGSQFSNAQMQKLEQKNQPSKNIVSKLDS